jgi:hypothetical protein
LFSERNDFARRFDIVDDCFHGRDGLLKRAELLDLEVRYWSVARTQCDDKFAALLF